MEITATETDKKPDVIYVGLKLNKKTDSDILSEIGESTTRQIELKRLIRMGMRELERQETKKKLITFGKQVHKNTEKL